MSDRRRSRRRGGEAPAAPEGRQVDYVRLKNPFPTMNAFSEDRIEAMHQAALQNVPEEEREEFAKMLTPESSAEPADNIPPREFSLGPCRRYFGSAKKPCVARCKMR